MENILALVTTPFAFATLIVLAATGLLEINRKRAGGVGISGQGFWLILIFGILANAAFVFKDVVFSDITLRGEIRQPNGRPVPNATIDVAGVGRAASSDLGVFELSIPYSRQAQSYTIYPFFNGIPGKKIELTGKKPDLIKIEYTTDAQLRDYVETHDIVVISQNIGIPIINVLFRTNSQISGRVKLNLYQVNVTRPNGESIVFLPAFVSRNNIPTPIGDFIIDYENQSAEYLIMTQIDPARQTQIGQAMMQRYGQYWMQDCFGIGIMPDAEASLQTHFDNNFFWLSGKYVLQMKYRLEGNVRIENYEFNLTAAESEKLQKMRAQLKYCKGVAFDMNSLQMLNYTDGSANNVVNASIRPM